MQRGPHIPQKAKERQRKQKRNSLIGLIVPAKIWKKQNRTNEKILFALKFFLGKHHKCRYQEQNFHFVEEQIKFINASFFILEDPGYCWNLPAGTVGMHIWSGRVPSPFPTGVLLYLSRLHKPLPVFQLANLNLLSQNLQPHLLKETVGISVSVVILARIQQSNLACHIRGNRNCQVDLRHLQV